MNYKVLNVLQADEWRMYLEMLPPNKQDVYYTSEYYQLYEDYGDGEAQCFVYQDERKLAIYPFLKNNVNVLGYELDIDYFDIQGAYGYNGVISNNDSEDFIYDFYKNFDEYCLKENIIAEFTRFHPLMKNQYFSNRSQHVVYDRKTVFLSLKEDLDGIWNNSFSSNNRNMIRKALKNNVEIFLSDSEKDYVAFYELYVETMKNVNSNDYFHFDKNYFLSFKKLLPNNHKLILAKLGEEIIGGMILMFHNNFAHYHLSGRKVAYGKFALNNLFLNFAIKEAKKLNCELFHFGGGTTASDKDSLLKFKSNFSKEKADFYIGKKIHNKKIYDEVVETWEKLNNTKREDLKNVLLKYRM